MPVTRVKEPFAIFCQGWFAMKLSRGSRNRGGIHMADAANLEPGWLQQDIVRATERTGQLEATRTSSARPVTLVSGQNVNRSPSQAATSTPPPSIRER